MLQADRSAAGSAAGATKGAGAVPLATDRAEQQIAEIIELLMKTG